MEWKKTVMAAWGPIKTISVIWVFLILIITFINFIFFDTKGLLYFLQEYSITFGIVSVVISGLLFLLWLLIWNILIKAFFSDDLKYMEKNGIKLEN